MILSQELQMAVFQGRMSPGQAFVQQAAADCAVETIAPEKARATAKALVTKAVIESPLGAALVVACARLGIHLELQECYTGYVEAAQVCVNLITWGMNRPQEWYLAGGRNVLFLENGLLRQRHGVYIDAGGYFGDSSLVTTQEWRRQPSVADLASLDAHLQREFGWVRSERFSAFSGPLMVALQTPLDAPLRLHCQHQGDGLQYVIDCAAHYLPKDIPVVLRPHPRHETFRPADYRIPDAWTIDRDGDVYARLRQCRALVTANSTLGIEAMAFGLPVAFLGRHVYTGSGAALECDGRPQRLGEPPTWSLDPQRVEALLCAILRRQLSYRATPTDVLASPQFMTWADRCLRGSTVPASRLSTEIDGPAYEAAAMRLRAGADPLMWDLVHATDTALDSCAGDCRKRHLRRIIDADLALHGRPPVWGPERLAKLQDAGLDVWRPDLRGYRDRLDEAKAAAGPRLDLPAGDVTLGFLYASHLGDSLCTTALAVPLAASGRRVAVVRHRSTYTAFQGHDVAWRNDGCIRLSAPAEVGHGNHIQRLLRWFGLPEAYYPRPDIRLSPDERAWADSVIGGLPYPLIIVCPEAVTNADGYDAMPWEAWVDALVPSATLIQPIGSGRALPGCIWLDHLTSRQFLALFSLAHAYLGTWAGGIHVAAAFGIETICVCKPPVSAQNLTFPVPLRHILSFLYPQHAYGWVTDHSPATPKGPS